ncbi:MAG TPA: hypothetical protein VH740_08675 [Vicinamibacterales bacterium]|jgi:hypothetical protein
MSLGNIIPAVLFGIVSLLPVVITIWAVLTLRDIQGTLESMDGKLDAIARGLQKP